MLVAALKVVGIIARRLGAGIMQYRLQAAYRRRVTRRYLELPLAWHQDHSTGELLSNANSDVEATWYPIAPFPFASASSRCSSRRWACCSSPTRCSRWSGRRLPRDRGA
jgi:hypothetical protein